MDRNFHPLKGDDHELYGRHAKGIEKKVRETFPSIPSNFVLKPVTIRKTHGCGMFYDFMIALPDGKFAKVSFHSGGHPIQRAPGEPEPEEHYNVDETPMSSEYE
ncbi:unnamed protein product [Rotaria sordida]|uniref:Uncharacterized protein n=1 Tax=Rotaria sordida TaxID=392033 RepID=A0A819MBJ7_9BILA|nr:unnamed protein product [Rotaria sordida]CAF3976844.1 unnamed protein product [Rotaria sordida]